MSIVQPAVTCTGFFANAIIFLLVNVGLGAYPSSTAVIYHLKTLQRSSFARALIGFVHEFRPLDATQMQELLEKEMDTCRRNSSGRTTGPRSDSEPHTNDRRKLQALDPTSYSDS
jgi:hypothetical protein